MVGGQLLAVSWFGRTVYVLKRTPEMLDSLNQANPRLADPFSKDSDQPDGASNNYRSLKPEFLVVEGVCTHLGCNVGHIGSGVVDALPNGGFQCPCHGSWYDLAGRVGRNLPAPKNLGVPAHRFIDDHTLQLGRA
jgi:ubiquinol-cytochrome c reductase iron-sulfur subunit